MAHKERTLASAIAHFHEAVADYRRAREWYNCAIEEENRITGAVYTELQRLGGPDSPRASAYLSTVREAYNSAKLRSAQLLAVEHTAFAAVALHHALCLALGKRDVLRAMGDLDEAFAQTSDAELEARYPASTVGYPAAIHDLARETHYAQLRNKKSPNMLRTAR